MAADSSLPMLEVFSRPGCHLCEELIEELLPLVRGKLAVEVRNIDENEAWQQAYALKIPVLVYQGQTVCEFRLDRDALQRIVGRL